MNTPLLHAEKAEDVVRAGELLKAGALVAIPTETVYGLAADAMQAEAVRKIFAAKNRPADHPLIVHIDSFASLEQWVRFIPAHAEKLAAAFWPGPLTMILPKAAHVPTVVTGGLNDIGLRVPAHPVLLDLLRTVKIGLAAPSANLYQQLSPTTAAQVLKQLNGRIDAVLDAGPCAVGLESTIIDLSDDTPRILRPGPISKTQIELVLGIEVEQPLRHSKRVSGNDDVHYQPRATLTVASAHQFITLIKAASDTKTAWVSHDAQLLSQLPDHVITHQMPVEKSAYAKTLYDTLHQLDDRGVRSIIWQQPPQEAAWHDVNDRLRRAGRWLD